MNIYISHLIEDKELFEILEHYPVGIEMIKFSISSVLDYEVDEIKEYEKQMGDYLVQRPLSLHGPFFDLSPASFDSEIRRVTKERFETAYTIAKKLGAKHIIYHSGFIPITYYIEGWLGNSIEFWKEFMTGKDESIEVHMENVYEEEFWPIRQVIDEVGHPAFSACLDIGHVNAYSSKSLDEWIEGLGNRIKHVHIHNNDGTKDQHLALGEGTIDMNWALTKIKQTMPEASWTMEIANKEKLIESIKWLEQDRMF